MDMTQTAVALWDLRSNRTGMLDVPLHPGVICPECANAGVMIRGDVCECGQCHYVWRSLLLVGGD